MTITTPVGSTGSEAIKSSLYYDVHVFMCTNERAAGHPRGCCKDKQSIELRTYMKAQAKNQHHKNIRINSAGCLDRCELGPVMVIYPEGVWYSYSSKTDIDEILASHIGQGQIVDRLKLSPSD